MSHQPEDPAETAEWETQKRATAERKPWATIGPVPTHGPDFIDLLAAPPAEPAQPPTTDARWVDLSRVSGYLVDGEVYQQRDVEILMRPGTSVDYAGPYTNVLECAPAGLTPEQTIRHHALTHAMTWIDSCGCGTPDDGDLWTVADQLANYIRDGSRP